jgi:hypothetical protein
MIRKRNKETIGNEVNNETSLPIVLSEKEIKTYKDEAILFLNELEKSGINIYDVNNYGGMYLTNNKNKHKNILSSNLKSKFIESNNIINKEDNKNNDLNNLFQHFKNK